MKEASRYDDMIHMPRPELKKHDRASRESRAAQFGAFRCLTGYEDAVAETARYTDNMPIVSEQMMDIINHKIQVLREHLDDKPEITIVYFKPDEKKDGGSYVTVTGKLKKIDDIECKFVLTNKKEIPVNSILELDGDVFKE